MLRLPHDLGAFIGIATIAAVGFSLPAAGDTATAHMPSANVAMTNSAPPPAGPTLPAQTIQRHSDGLFYVEAKANGTTIRFVVDTGATVVVLNKADAEKLGIPYDQLVSKASMRTAGGSSDMRWAKIDRLDMGAKRIEKIEVAVVEGGLPVSLMGQNALEQLGTLTLRGNTMTIH
ncbi:MAG: retroviral-like aspartic protease family protein [Sphingomonadales bacterium]|nr:retroviral-like aspartic protease family protein [Sphingomonadales bacterium]